MSRHGDCVTLPEAAHRLEDLRDITNPSQFAIRLRRQGVAVQTRELLENGTRAVIVEAPERGLSMLFVPKAACR